MDLKSFRLPGKSFTTNGILLIVVAALMLEAISMIQYRYAREEIAIDLHLRAQSELMAKSLSIQNILSQVESAVDNHVWDAERLLPWPDSAYTVVKRLVEQNPEIIGSSLSFEPNYYPQKGYWFESYAVKRDSTIESMQLGSAEHDYTQMEFYKIPMQLNAARWTEPYLDSDGARMLLTTYSQPIHDNSGRPIAVLDADLSLDWLKNVLSVKYVYPSSFPILISRSGQLMSYPESDYIMQKTLADVANQTGDSTFLEINGKMMAGESGNAVVKDRRSGERFHIFYAPVGGETGWSLAVVSSEKEIFGHYNKMRDTLLLLRLAALAILIFIIARSVRNINRLQKVTVERERIKSELKVASEIQMGMLPRHDAMKAANAGIDIAGVLEPAKEVGGDLYDYYIKDDYLYFCIGDVSGKGVPAAMFMTVTRSLFRTISPYTLNASKILWYMNRTLADLNGSNMFVTFFVGILNRRTGELNYANAGHNGPLIIENEGVHTLEVMPNLPLGVWNDFSFARQEAKLRPGSILFLYTDGLTEAMNGNKQEYGEERMLAALQRINTDEPDLSSAELLERVTRDVKNFVHKAEQSDDLTLIALKIKQDNNIRKRIVLGNDISSVKILNEFIDRLAQDCGLDMEESMEIKLALEEAVVNIIEHAYPAGQKDEIAIEMEVDGNEFRIEITDKGAEFDPTAVPDANTLASAEERPIGGLGIFLIRRLMNEVNYRREDGENILTLSKKIKS